MANNLGDYAPSTVLYGKFTTYRPSTGAAFTLGGTPALSVYKDNSTTQSTSGVTLTADFDSVTGLNHFAIDTSSDGTFYSAGSNFDVVITTGTVDSVSVVGSVVGSFSINKVAALRPTTAGRTLDVSSGGEAGVDWANVGSPTTSLNLSGTTISTSQAVASVSGAVGSVTGNVGGNVTGSVGSVTGNVGGNVTGSVGSVASGGISEASFATTAGPFAPLGIIDQGTAQSATATEVVLRSAAAFGDNTLVGSTIMVYGSTQGYWQSGLITANVGSTDTVTVATWPVTPSGTITYKIFGTAAASGGGGSLTAADVWTYATRRLTDATNIVSTGTSIPITGSRVDCSVGAYQTGLTPLQPTTSGRTLDVSATGEAGIDWANVGSPTTSVNLSGTTISTSQAVASVSGAVGSVTGAVGSVTGNVGGNVTGSVGSVTGNVGGNVVGTVAGVTPATNAGILTTALTESYATDGAAPTLSQSLFAIQQFLQERAVSGTTLTVKKLDGSTSAMTFTLNDASSPTSITRAT